MAKNPVRIVGIGASAGGLEAFTELLRHLPTDAGVAYVLVQHLDPTHRSLLSELLARVTTLPVTEIAHNSRVEANQIYVIPPNTDLAVENGTLKLSPRRKNGGPARSIDHFLKSLAEDQKDAAIAVILSGAGSDGALGLKAVKAAGGLTFAQDEASAKYNSMPRAAAATGCVDFVLSPEKIAEEIARFIRYPHATKGRAAANARRRAARKGEGGMRWAQRLSGRATWPAPPTDINLRKVFTQLRARTGVDFSYYKINTIRRRLSRRMAANKIKNLEAYAQFLREHPHEVETLYQDFLINVSSFFRNPSSFELLKRKVFPRMVRHHNGADALRIWVAGCAMGQEAYSLAMAFVEFLEQCPQQVPLQIFATDLNGSVLDKARAARYTKAQIEGVSAKRLGRFFVADEGGYRVQKAIRDMVVFAQHNLLTDPPFTRVDLVTCRNVLIYLEPALQQKILPTFHYALKPEGFLWLGTSESIGQFSNLFGALEKTHRIYIRKPAATWLRVERPPLFPTKVASVAPPTLARSPEFNVVDAQKEADRVTLTKYSPAGVLVNEDLEILQFRGDTAHYLTLPSGKANFQLLKMARDGLALPLQRILTRAKKENRLVRETAVCFGGRKRAVNIEVVPLKNLKVRCFLVFFDRPGRSSTRGAREAGPAINGGAKRHSRQAADSRLELTEMREQLHSIQEEHETAVEELQASNEEVQSSNEELQSLNEELETSNEELESANEELTTLNEELATRNTELRESEQRLREQAQLLDMAPILARSPKDRIIFWSGGAEAMYGFSKEEAIGQTSHILLNTHFHEPLDAIQAKLLRDGFWDGEVQHRRKDGRILHVATQWVLHRDNEGKLRAILEVTTDITARKEAEKALRASEEFNRGILENSPDCIEVLDMNGRVLFMNAGAQRLLDSADMSSRVHAYWPNFFPTEGRSQAEEAVRQALVGQTGRFRAMCPKDQAGPKWWDVVVTPILDADRRPERLLVVQRDVTEHMHLEQARAEQARLHALRADIAVAIAETSELRPTLQKIAEHLVRHLECSFACVWLVGERSDLLEPQALAGLHFESGWLRAPLRIGQLRVGRIAQQQTPFLCNDVQNDPEVIEPDLARRENIVAFAGYPLVATGTATGVVAVFSTKPFGKRVLDELSFAANSIAQYLRRQRAETARSQAQERLNRYAEDLERSVKERTATLTQIIGELEAFSYSVSHDLRTPLRAMEGYAQALLEDAADQLTDTHRGYLERIVRGARRLDHLTLDVLAYSRLSRTEFTPQAIDLNKLVHDIIEQYPQFEAARAHIQIQAPLAPVLGHSAFLTQCISNLFGNALKFVDPGTTPNVKVWTERLNGVVRLHIEDNGIGIAPEHRERIFKIFGRIYNDKRYEGTGIGLAVVKRAVDRMGGTVDFESHIGKGTRFWIDLPSAGVD